MLTARTEITKMKITRFRGATGHTLLSPSKDMAMLMASMLDQVSVETLGGAVKGFTHFLYHLFIK